MQELARVLQRRAPVLRGTVYEHKVHCGRPKCVRCPRGEFHPRWTLSRTEDGRTVLYNASPELRTVWEEQTGEWRAYRRAVADLRKSLRVILGAGERLAALREVQPQRKGE